MRPYFRIRDPIHGFVELGEAEAKAVDAACFQRLREIRQLAMTNLVYPGALHTRFDHSLGVCHIAGKLGEEIELDPDDLKVVRTAALLHDLGHGPFSHVTEEVLDLQNGVSGVHEAISVAIMRTDPELQAAFGEELLNRAADLVAHTGNFAVRSAMRDIVSGPSDADKLDYLRRDSYFAGVDYGRFDLNRLIDTATVIAQGDVESYLGFTADGVWAVEGLLLARHHMHRQVYGHKTRIASDLMIQRALTLGLQDGAVDPAAYTVSIVDGHPAPDKDFLAAYAGQTDASLLHALRSQEQQTASRDLAERLTSRRLLRRSARIALQDVRTELGGPKTARILDNERTTVRLPALEEQIADTLNCPAHLVALRIEQPGNPVFRRPDADVGPQDILLHFADRPPDIIQRVSEIFRDATEANQRFASLYTPKIDQITPESARELLWTALNSL